MEVSEELAWSGGTGSPTLCEHACLMHMDYPCPSSSLWQVASYEAQDPFVLLLVVGLKPI